MAEALKVKLDGVKKGQDTEKMTDDPKGQRNNIRNFGLEKDLSQFYGISYDEIEAVKDLQEAIKKSKEPKKDEAKEMQFAGEVTDDPEWEKNNDRKQFLDELLNKVGGDIKAAENKIKELDLLKKGQSSNLAIANKQLYKAEKKWWIVGRFFFSKDIQNIKKRREDILDKWSVHDTELKEVEATLSTCKENSFYLAKQKEMAMTKEAALEEKYRKKAEHETGMAKSATNRRQGIVEQKEKDSSEIPNDRKLGMIRQTERDSSEIPNNRKLGMIRQTERDSSEIPNNRKLGMIRQTERDSSEIPNNRKLGTIRQTENNLNKLINNSKQEAVNNQRNQHNNQNSTSKRKKVTFDR